ncbi:MAG: InlB B-repeat-containing protein [Clostridia bacterium]|nr:InlB B-repeat-containing protein [Clostridia bacterium]
MKKIRLSTILLLMLSLLGSIFILASCNGVGGNYGGTTPITPTKLTAPTVVLTDDTATWSADAFADKFEISTDGNLSYIENSVTSRKLVNGQTFKIRAIGDGVNYTNSDWSNSVTYEGLESPKYTVIWKNGDSVLETDTEVSQGTIPTYDGAEPTKASDAQYSYVFAGWSPEIVEANGDITYTAVFTSVINKYTVTWKNGDNILETDENVEYGVMPVYNGAEPQKAADKQYIYVFSGWSPVVSEVIGNVTYEAQFASAPNSYTIVWKNGDAELEIDEDVAYGSTPSYDGATPTKTTTAQYTYTFSGWTPQISSVTESVTYQAQFTETLRSYTVTFYSEDGLTILDTVTVEYGSEAVYSKITPVKNATEGHTYVFEKWVTTQGGSVADDLTNVIGDRSVYASFKEFVRTVTVYIVSNNTDYGTVSVSTLNNVPYGATITVNGNTIDINGQSVTANANTATAQYTYAFTSWSADATVGNDTIITANFSRSVNSYTVIWKNGDTVLETDENVAYGTTPVYNGVQPTKESDEENIYTFSGWSPAVSSVTGNIIYIAQFTTTANKHIVVFYDDDGMTELGRVVVGHGETAIYPNALPTKESTAELAYTFEKWVTAKDGATEASFTNITEDKSVYAKYSTAARTYVVTFCDYDGTTISQIDVAYGNAATAPGDPERDGYRFDGWDKTFSSITGELTVMATYVQQFTVEFLNYDNSVIDIQLVDYNGNATAPENPTRNNYRFTGWNTGFSNVVHDLTVKAEYIRQYKVTFLDYNGTVLKETTVDAGSAAVAPSDPAKEGYTFYGWDIAFTNVSSNLTINATYKVKTYIVKFVMPDGVALTRNYCDNCDNYHNNADLIDGNCPLCEGGIIKITEQTVEHGFSAIAPEYPEFCLEGSGDYTEVYGFTRWNKSFNNVTEDLIIEAVYESDYTKPVIIIEYSQERNGDAKLYIYNHESIKLNAIEFTINYSTNVGNISINSATVNSASPLWVEDSDGNNNNQYVINNNESTFTFAWSDANGKQFDWCSKVVTFNFSTDGAVVGEETFRIDGCSAIVSDSNGENLEKITPVVVYR